MALASLQILPAFLVFMLLQGAAALLGPEVRRAVMAGRVFSGEPRVANHALHPVNINNHASE